MSEMMLRKFDSLGLQGCCFSYLLVRTLGTSFSEYFESEPSAGDLLDEIVDQVVQL